MQLTALNVRSASIKSNLQDGLLHTVALGYYFFDTHVNTCLHLYYTYKLQRHHCVRLVFG
jgi:hypothetical protein